MVGLDQEAFYFAPPDLVKPQKGPATYDSNVIRKAVEEALSFLHSTVTLSSHFNLSVF